MFRKLLLAVCLWCVSAGAWAGDLNKWTARGNPVSVVREVTHSEVTHKVTVFFRTAARLDQTVPITCPASLWNACLLGASPTSSPHLLRGCSYVPYASLTVLGDPIIKRTEVWHCSGGVSRCQNAEAWVRETGGGLELVATGNGGPATGCTVKP